MSAALLMLKPAMMITSVLACLPVAQAANKPSEFGIPAQWRCLQGLPVPCSLLCQLGSPSEGLSWLSARAGC